MFTLFAFVSIMHNTDRVKGLEQLTLLPVPLSHIIVSFFAYDSVTLFTIWAWLTSHIINIVFITMLCR